jgi:VCBS repeat-containing protein
MDGLALDLPHHVAYFASETSAITTSTTKNGHPDPSDPNGNIHYNDSIGSNAIWETSPLTSASGANSITFTKLLEVPIADGSLYDGVGMPGIAVDTTTGIIYFTTQSIVSKNVEGGIFSLNPITKVITQIWRQTGAAGTLNSGILNSINVDDATGKYYVSIIGAGGTGGAIYVGSLTGIGVAPTLFLTVPTYNGNTVDPIPYGFDLDNAPTMASVTGTATEAVQGGAAVTLLTATGADADTDNDKGDGLTVTITNGQTGDQLEIGGAQSGTLDGGKIDFSYNSTTHAMSLIGTDTFAEYQTVLGQIQFKDTGTDNSSGSHPTRTIDYSYYDGLLSSNVQSTTLIIDRPPTLATHTFGVLEGATSGPASLGDSDLDGDTVTVSAVTDGTVGSPDPGDFGTLTINTNSDTYTYTANNTTNINAAATGSHPVDTFTYTASDGNGGTTLETLKFTIDRPPSAVADAYSVNEGSSVSGTSGTVGTGVLHNDSDPDGDSFTVVDVDGNSGGVAHSVSGTYGELTLNANGSFTYSADQTAAINGAAPGSAPTDTFNYTISDGFGGSSTANVSFTIDRPPAVTTSSHTVKYDQGGSPVVIDSGVQVIDVNASSLASATVKISNFQAGDVLGIVAGQLVGNAIDGTNITESYNGSGTLTLTGIDSATDYQIALDEVIFSNTAASPSLTPRTIDFSATDVAGAQSDTGTDTVDVLGLPVVGGTGNTVKFYQGGPATALDSVILVTDPNGDNITGATVTIGGTFSTGDALADNGVSNGGTVLGGITASYNSSTHVLTLSGSDTAADYQTALREVTYSFSGDPTDAGADKTRTIAWSVTDADAVTSATGSTTTLDVFAQPIVTVGAAGTPTETSTSGPVIADSTLSITDYNGTTIHDASVQITSGHVASDTLTINGATTGTINDGGNGTISYSFAGTTLTLTGTDTVADYTTALDEVKFDAVSPNSGTRTLSWQVNDEAGGNTNDSVPVTTNVDVAFGPELTGGQNFGETEGTSTGPLQLVTFTDSEIASPTTANFTATINWGDGTALDTTGTIVSKGGGVFAVDSAGHTYAEAQAAPYQIAVTVTDTDSVAGAATDNAQVADAPLTAGTLAVDGGVEGTTPATLSATFSDANTAAPTSDFSGTIDWGDGNTTNFTSGDVAANGSGAFTVSGSHLYAEDGSDNVTVTINDVGGSQTTETTSTTVADAPLTAGTVTVGGGVEGTTPATLSATFSDANTGAPTGDFSGTIAWGDGNTTNFTSGDVAANGGGAFTVNGSHLYAEEGPDNVTVTINDKGGSQTIEIGSTTVADAPLTAGAVTVGGGVEGTTPVTLSAAFTDANAFATDADFSGTIDCNRHQRPTSRAPGFPAILAVIR